MVHFVYVIRSEKNGRFYTGQASDMSRRVAMHNAGKVKSTKYLIPWKIFHTETFESATDARKKRRFFKKSKK